MSANYNEYSALVKLAKCVLRSKSLFIANNMLWGWPTYVLEEIISGRKKPKPCGLKKNNGIKWEDYVIEYTQPSDITQQGEDITQQGEDITQQTDITTETDLRTIQAYIEEDYYRVD